MGLQVQGFATEGITLGQLFIFHLYHNSISSIFSLLLNCPFLLANYFDIRKQRIQISFSRAESRIT